MTATRLSASTIIGHYWLMPGLETAAVITDAIGKQLDLLERAGVRGMDWHKVRIELESEPRFDGLMVRAGALLE